MSAEPRERFGGVAADYARHRPSYPDALIDWIVAQAGLKPGDKMLDVGCGTGISTRAFSKRKLEAVGLEPNDAMRAQAEKEDGGPRYIKGQAEATGLAAASFDLVTAAQCFHWFDFEAALAEFARLLAPGRRACAFWNLRRDTPVLRDYEKTIWDYAKDFREQPKGRETYDRFRARADLREKKVASFPNSQTFDLEGLLGRARSMSYVSVSVEDRAGFDRAMEEVFRRHERNGGVTFDYDACAVMWTPRP